MSTILVNPPVVRSGGTESFFAWQKRQMTSRQYASMPMEHLGLASVAAYADALGVDVTVVNGMTSCHTSIEQTWEEIVAAARRDGPPTLVGLSNIDTLDEVLVLAELARTEWPETAIALGNVFATLNYTEILRRYPVIDHVVVGEGEASFTALAVAMAEGAVAEPVPGVTSRGTGRPSVATGAKPLDLDDLPWPDRRELPSVLRHGFAASVFTTRGCPYRCTFCGTGAMSALLGRAGYREKSPENVVAEVERLVRDFGVSFVSFVDDLFVGKHPVMQDRARRIAQGLLGRRLDISFMIDIRVDSVVDLDLFRLLRRAGLRRVFIGIETGSRDQLLAYDKRTVRRQQDPATLLRQLDDLGIEVVPGTIMFHPTVTSDEVRQTARLLRATGYEAPRKFAGRVAAYPGTPLHAQFAAAGHLVSEWPLGEWEFADPAARRAYDRIVDFLDTHPEATHDDAEAYVHGVLDDWEAGSLDDPQPNAPPGDPDRAGMAAVAS
jgi:hypothetical protein